MVRFLKYAGGPCDTTMKKYTLHGSVDRITKEDVTKRQTEGAGENKKTRVVTAEQYVAVIIGPDGQRVRITQDDAFDFVVEEVVSVVVEYGKQMKLDDEPVPKRK